MYESTLIILAAGGSRAHVQKVIKDHPRARVWTLNATRHEREELQFEIHAPEPLNALNPFVPAIVSRYYSGPPMARLGWDDKGWRQYIAEHPEYAKAVESQILPVVDGPEVAGCPQPPQPAPAPRIPFPLEAASELGMPFFELSHDYMLAFAALIHTRWLPDSARVPGLSMRPFERILLCGVDLNDNHHFARSRGAHFWIGFLRGHGIAIEPMPESTLLAGGINYDVPAMPKLVRPFYYGQPVAQGGNC